MPKKFHTVSLHTFVIARQSMFPGKREYNPRYFLELHRYKESQQLAQEYQAVEDIPEVGRPHKNLGIPSPPMYTNSFSKVRNPRKSDFL